MPPVALVTGGARRVGRAISLGLADAGFDLVVNYNSSAREADEVVALVESMGRRAIAVEGDVSVAADVEAVAEATRDRFGRLDVLVNNASIFPQTPFLEIEEVEWDRVMAVNLKAPFLLVKAMADDLTRARGSVVNLVDLSAIQPWVEHPHHAVSKAGLLHLTRVMARALAPHVRVNAIAPGAVLPPEDYTEEDLKRSAKKAALGRIGSPDDVVETVLFLLRSGFMTGEVVVVDGGRQLGF
ncbi:MAG: SDR family oxidoreductase [Gemmatimonadales bacterium]|nr:MAG: SDR family oxidoreductase [Gemmatimonadales bacterium]